MNYVFIINSLNVIFTQFCAQIKQQLWTKKKVHGYSSCYRYFSYTSPVMDFKNVHWENRRNIINVGNIEVYII